MSSKGQLPAVHGDPFDSKLMAQAREEGLLAVTFDARWHIYDVSMHRA
ncbi:MAG: hypothetical protein NTW02_02095 [Cyanobium sp. LacPavin_0920_WC12_MAG_62_9]|nr:hypothetical protein [Cyanobium sp. LacPavin_0920_WC12_MAG_62_9]